MVRNTSAEFLTDVTTVEEIVAAMENKYRQTRRIWVMDRGATPPDGRVRSAFQKGRKP